MSKTNVIQLSPAEPWNTPTASLKRGKKPPMNVRCMTLNRAMTSLRSIEHLGIWRIPLLPSLPGLL